MSNTKAHVLVRQLHNGPYKRALTLLLVIRGQLHSSSRYQDASLPSPQRSGAPTFHH